MTYRPQFRQEGPSSSCIIDGKALGWTNCTPASFAMLIDRSTIGAHSPDPCMVRKATLDVVGGTTIPQNAKVATGIYHVPVEQHTGSGVCSPSYAARQLRAGRGMALQGNAVAMVNTAFRSTGGAVNHCVYVNEVRGGTLDAPAEALVYDPAADGRSAAWGHADQGPSWWPWWLVLRFAASLRPTGDDGVPLGSGKFYCAFGPDTEPDVVLKYGGQSINPPKVKVIDVATGRRANARVRPTTAAAIGQTLADGQHWTAWQVTKTGQLLAGSRTWYGNRDGTRWIHSSSF